jgi:hypothetical protein
MYTAFQGLYEVFMQKDKLKQVFQPWDMNAWEGFFNQLITKFLPKDQTYCKIIENLVIIHLGLCTLSIRYKNFHKRPFTLTGLSDGECNLLYLRLEDKEQIWRRNNKKKESVKISWMRYLYIKLTEGRQRLIVDNAEDLM